MRRRQWLTIGIGPVLALAMALGALLIAATPVLGAGTVGTGSAASCDEAAFDAAFAGGGLITFNCGPDPVGITFTGTKALTADTTIDGGGLIAFNGNDTVRLFTTSGFDLTLQGLIFTDAHADDFGAVVLATNATIAFVDSTAVDGTASFGAVAALFVTGGSSNTIAASGSTFVGNEAANQGGVFWVQPVTFDGESCIPPPAEANVVIVNSTFNENSAGGAGAVVYMQEIFPCGDVGNILAAYSTFAGNTADELFALSGGAGVNIEARLGANVIGPNEADCAAGPGAFTSLGFNVTDDATCFTAPTTGDQVVANTMLGPLADNGGLTETMALLPGAAALDSIPFGSGECGDLADDQRGIIRPQGTHCDAGAYEQVVLTDTATVPPQAPVPTPLVFAGLLLIGLAAVLPQRMQRSKSAAGGPSGRPERGDTSARGRI